VPERYEDEEDVYGPTDSLMQRYLQLPQNTPDPRLVEALANEERYGSLPDALGPIASTAARWYAGKGLPAVIRAAGVLPSKPDPDVMQGVAAWKRPENLPKAIKAMQAGKMAVPELKKIPEAGREAALQASLAAPKRFSFVKETPRKAFEAQQGRGNSSPWFGWLRDRRQPQRFSLLQSDRPIKEAIARPRQPSDEPPYLEVDVHSRASAPVNPRYKELKEKFPRISPFANTIPLREQVNAMTRLAAVYPEARTIKESSRVTGGRINAGKGSSDYNPRDVPILDKLRPETEEGLMTARGGVYSPLHREVSAQKAGQHSVEAVKVARKETERQKILAEMYRNAEFGGPQDWMTVRDLNDIQRLTPTTHWSAPYQDVIDLSRRLALESQGVSRF